MRHEACHQCLDRSDHQHDRARSGNRWPSEFVAYKVTNPSAGVWHYEYAIYNENLDRAIQSFSVPLGMRSHGEQSRISCAAAIIPDWQTMEL